MRVRIQVMADDGDILHLVTINAKDSYHMDLTSFPLIEDNIRWLSWSWHPYWKRIEEAES